jgi:hypothetical protein
VKANLDKWIKDAKDDVPDSGEYRRLNRALLKGHMANMAPRRRRRHRVLLGSLSLVFLMLFSGQLNQLGSDDFDLIMEDWVSPLGKDVPVAKHQFSGQSFTGLEDLSTEDLDEFYRAVSAGEGEIVWVQGTSYGGKTKWLKYVKQVVNGKIVNRGGVLDDRPFVEPDNYLEFLVKHVHEIEKKTRTEPHQSETVMTFDGVVCNVKIWVFHFPEYGEVIRYVGTPIQEK